MRKICLLAAMIVAVLGSARPARADGFIIPFVGADFSGDSGSCRTITPCSPKQLVYGGDVGFMVGGLLGVEGDFAYAPHFFGEGSGLSDNYVATAMVNARVGIPAGPVRPYVVGGIGVIHTDVSQSTVGLYNAITNNDIAFDVGGGLMVFFGAHVGVQGDVRYMRTFNKLSITPLDLNNAALEFGRGTIGLVLRF
jgi:opacity protein-like surface antigen